MPLVMWYSYWPDNTVLVAGTGNPLVTILDVVRKYYASYTLGYIYTNLSDAQEYGPDAVPLYHYRYGNYGASSGKDIDDFYTINPAGEINLVDNPIPCRKPLDREYQYVGIVGYVYPADAPGAPQETVIDVGKLGPTGQCIDKTGWYAFDNETGPFNWRVYNRGGQTPDKGTPGVIGFGNPDNAEILTEAANFEWAWT